MSDNININVTENIDQVNIVASEIVEVVDLNLYATTEDVTINVTEEIIQVNINKVTGGSNVTKTSDLINDGEDGINPFITLEDIPPIDVSSLVPYTGATQNVDLGEYEIKAGQVEFDQTPTGAAGVGVMRWNDTDGTIDLGLKGGNVTLQVGQENVVRVVNKTATNINLLESNYQAVRVTGAQGQRLKVDLALATNDLLSAETIGLVTETINNNQEGFITTSGLIRGINTTGSLQGETWADGDVLYLSPTTAGRVTNIKPSAPNHLVVIGYVIHAHANQGSIFVKVDNGYELEELHNVTSTNYTTPINTDSVLTYDVTNSLWKRLSWSNIKSNLKTYFDGIYESLSNKSTSTSLGTSDTLYPTQNAVKVYADTKLDKVTSGSERRIYGVDASNNQEMVPVSDFISPTQLLEDFYNKSSKVVIEWVPYANMWGTTLAPAVTGTADNVAPSFSGNLFLKQFRRRYASAATAGSSTSFRDSSFRHTSIQEGFISFFIFGNEDVANVAQARSFCGLIGGNGEIGNVNPSTITNTIGVANNSGQANLHFINTAGSLSIDLGSDFPSNTNSTDFYLLIMINDKGVSNLKWRVVNLHSGADTGYSTITTGLPITTLGLAPQVWRNNGSTALAVRNSIILYRLLKL